MSAKKRKTGHFLLPKMSFPIRFGLILLLVGTGMFIQLYYAQFVVGLLIVLIGSLFGARRSMTTKVELRGQRDPAWETVSYEEWQRIEKLKKTGNRWKSDFTNISSGLGIMVFSIIIVICMAIFIIYVDEDDALFIVFIANMMALFFPTMLLGSLNAWNPPGISVKLRALSNVHDHLENNYQGKIELRPMLGLSRVKGKDSGKSVPVDAKMMIKFPNAPDGFYGIQVQCSLNDVSGTKYPYLYAVILSEPKFDMDTKSLPRRSKDINFEPSTSIDARIVVIRQHTTKTSGYHTKESRQIAIVEQALKTARELVPGLEN